MSAAIPDAAHPAGGRRPGTPLVALFAGGLFGVLQTLLAQRCGLLQFATTRAGWWGVELSTLTWLSAVSVIVGVVVAARFGRRDTAGRDISRRDTDGRGTGDRGTGDRGTGDRGIRGRDASGGDTDRRDRDGRVDLLALSAAALGCLVTVPVTSSSVAWAALYGGAVPVYRAAVHVILGIGLGTVAGVLAQRYRSVAVGLLAGSGVVWATALLSALLGSDSGPVLGHPDLGLTAAPVLAQRIGALVVAFLAGAGFGAARYRGPAEARIVAAATGPTLVAVTFLTTVPVTGGSWPWSPLPSALAAIPCAALGTILALRLTDLIRPHDEPRTGKRAR